MRKRPSMWALPESDDSANMSQHDKMECPFHHRRWRGQMQCLLNALRGRLLKNKHIRMFPAAVCTCKEKVLNSPTDQHEGLQGLLQWLEDKSLPTSILGPAIPSLKRFLIGGSDPTHSRETREALVGVVSLVQELHAGDFHRLEPNQQDTLASEPAKGVELLEEEFELPLDSAYLGVFMGQGGKHIKPLCREHGVQVHFKAAAESGSGSQRPWRARHQYIGGASVKVVLRCKEGGWEGLQHMETALKKRVERVTHRRKEHEKDVNMYYKLQAERSRVLRQQARQRGGRQRVGVGIYQNSKEAAKGQFEKKQKAKAKNPPVKSSSVGLSSGHCLHCMAPYIPQQTEEGACKYHSGFLAPVKPGKDKGYYWSCCQKRTAAQHPTHEMHTRTGCSSGRHMWRAGKGGRGKTAAEKENATDHEEIFVK